jgi:hypothetical protein
VLGTQLELRLSKTGSGTVLNESMPTTVLSDLFFVHFDKKKSHTLVNFIFILKSAGFF